MRSFWILGAACALTTLPLSAVAVGVEAKPVVFDLLKSEDAVPMPKGGDYYIDENGVYHLRRSEDAADDAQPASPAPYLAPAMPPPYDMAGCGCESGDSYACGCGDVCSSCSAGSTWRTSLDWLYLHRDSPNDRTLAASGGTAVLRASDLDPDWDDGVRFTAEMAGCCADWQFVYTGVNWNDALVATGAGNIDSIAGSADFTGADRVDVTYFTDYDTVEFNRLVRWTPNTRILTGFRIVSLDEAFNLQATAGGNVSNYSINTENELYGFQIGAIHERCLAGRLQFRMLSKIGIYYNDADQQVLLRDVDNAATLRDFSNNNEEVAMVSELDFMLAYDLNCCWKLRSGYQLLWVEGVALAPEQFQATVGDANAALDTDGGFFAHGFYTGLEASW